jgi:hypothetical protein
MAAIAIALSVSMPIWSSGIIGGRPPSGGGPPFFIYATPDPEILRFGESSTVRLDLFNVGNSPAEVEGIEVFGDRDPAISGTEVIGAFPMLLPPKGNRTVLMVVRTSMERFAPEGGRALIVSALGPGASCPVYIWLVKRKAELRAEARATFEAGRLLLDIGLENLGDGRASGPGPSIFPPEGLELVRSPGGSNWELGPGERMAFRFELKNSTALSQGVWEIPAGISYGVMSEDLGTIAERSIQCVAKFHVGSGGAFDAFQSYGSSRWEVRYRVRVAPIDDAGRAVLRLKLPPSNSHQEVVSESFSPAPDRFEADWLGNRVAIWALGNHLGDGGFETAYRAVVSAKWIRARPPPDGTPPSVGNWSSLLAPEPMIESESEEVRAVADGFEDTGAFDLAAKAFEFVQRGIKYVPHSPEKWFAREPMGQGALMTLRNKFGICTDKADLLIALYRAKGLPARRSVGTVAGVFGSPSGQGHAWVEVWIPGCGFVPCDPTNELSFGELSQREVCLYYGQGLSIMPAEVEGGPADLSFEMEVGEPKPGPEGGMPAPFPLLLAPSILALALALLFLSKRLV